MSTLTDRYVFEVARRLPEKQREDIAAELRATIADMAEDRPEREVLQELGDPALLAAKYRDRPQYLIGPELYPQYVGLLGTLLSVVTPILAGVVFLAKLLGDSSGYQAFGAAVGAAIQVAVQIVFWTTLVFAVVERTSAGKEAKAVDLGEGAWTPDKLPDRAKGTQVGLGEFVAGMVVLALAAGFLVWQHTSFPLHNSAGDRVPLLDPALWAGWMWVLLAVVAAAAAVEVLKFRRGLWTYPLAAGNGAVNLAFLAVIGGLALAGNFVNPEFAAAVTANTDLAVGANGQTWLVANGWIIAAVVGLVVVVWDTVEGFVKARRAAALPA